MAETESENLRRRLGAVLFADVAGYSGLMADDEIGTHNAVKAHVQAFNELCGNHGGEILQIRGDGISVLFDSVVDAVRFGIEIQRTVSSLNRHVPDDRHIRFRIGINLGEIIRDDLGVSGDSVNIAARIENLAEPGSVCVSSAVYDQIKNKLDYGYQYLGPQRLKNIPEPIEVFRVREESEGADMTAGPRPSFGQLQREQELLQAPSVVVLPFRNLSGDPSEDWFSEGITEDVTTNLSKFHNLFVISRNSAFVYKNQNLDPKQASETFGVRYVVGGSVRKQGNRARITIELVDHTSGRTIWGEKYDRVLDDIFAVQDEITEAIVAGTAVHIEASERERMRLLMPSDLEAYGFVLQGQQRLFQYTRGDNREARELYEAALKADPRYSRAMAAISRTLNIDWRYSWSDSPEQALDEALEFAQQAVLLDETDARGFGELGFVHLYRKEHESAINAYVRALSLNPNDADLMSDMADALAHSGRSEEAIGLLQKAMRLNPFYPDQYLWHLGGAYYNLKRYEEAIDSVLRMHNPTEGRRLLAASYAQLGRASEAQDQASMVLRAHPNFSINRWASVQPDKFEDDLEHFVEGLKKAGL